MKNTLYLKTKNINELGDVYFLVNDNNIIRITESCIDVSKNFFGLKHELKSLKHHFNTVGCSKQEFDDFYIKTAKNINEKINQ